MSEIVNSFVAPNPFAPASSASSAPLSGEPSMEELMADIWNIRRGVLKGLADLPEDRCVDEVRSHCIRFFADILDFHSRDDATKHVEEREVHDMKKYSLS